MPAAHDGRVTSGSRRTTISPNFRPTSTCSTTRTTTMARPSQRYNRNALAHGEVPRRAATTRATTHRARRSRTGFVVVLTAPAMPMAHPHHAAGCTARGRVDLIGPSWRQARRFHAVQPAPPPTRARRAAAATRVPTPGEPSSGSAVGAAASRVALVEAVTEGVAVGVAGPDGEADADADLEAVAVGEGGTEGVTPVAGAVAAAPDEVLRGALVTSGAVVVVRGADVGCGFVVVTAGALVAVGSGGA